MRQTRLVAAVPEPIAKPSGGEGRTPLGHEEGQVLAGASVDYAAQLQIYGDCQLEAGLVLGFLADPIQYFNLV
jgi:hypothetical protein